jgi:transposase
MALVGLDVHQAQTVAAVLDRVSGELRVERLRGAPSGVVPEFLERLGRPVRAVYEAGPTGFGLARAATARGLEVRVIAPGSIPRAAGDRVKTDRRDAARLVRLFAAGELSYVFVPSEADERFSRSGALHRRCAQGSDACPAPAVEVSAAARDALPRTPVDAAA